MGDRKESGYKVLCLQLVFEFQLSQKLWRGSWSGKVISNF